VLLSDDGSVWSVADLDKAVQSHNLMAQSSDSDTYLPASWHD